MVSVWYPAREVRRHPLAPWMPTDVVPPFLASAGFDPNVALVPFTSGHESAPVLRTGRRLPVIVYSHGSQSHREDHTIVVQELASHGYMVVTVGHTYDTFAEFPGGRVAVPTHDRQYSLTPLDYAADIRFVLDRVDDLAAGNNPDADGKPLPTGLAGAPDRHRVGVFGWSKGGTATAYAMITDPRVQAGLSFDGPMEPLITTDLDRPFMDMTAIFTRAQEPAVAEFWTHLRGWHLNIQADGAVHSSYGDTQVLLPQVAAIIGMSAADLQGWIGTLDPARAVKIQQAYPVAFFNQHLRHRREHLLDGPSTDFPEVKFLP